MRRPSRRSLFAAWAFPLLAVSLPAADSPSPATTVAGPTLPSTDGPKIQFVDSTHDFGPIKRGDTAMHTFVFTNTGNAPLEIVDVQLTCGCTTAGTWDRQVAPGNTGGIPIQFATASLSGAILRTINVSSTDPLQPVVVLRISATVLTPVEVNPAAAIFQFTAGNKNREARTVRIVNHQPGALTVEEPKSTHAAFRAELRNVKPGREWDLMISTGPPPGSDIVAGVISLKTSSPEMPLLTVQAHAVLRPAIVVSPPQIVLPGTPLSAGINASITIMNTATNPLVLSLPKLGFAGPEVQLRELEPGRVFSLTVSFPAGFALPENAPAELTVNSSHPQYSVIRIPITQGGRPGG